MKHDLDVDLLRLLNGELPAAREQELRRRMAREPELAAAFRRLERHAAGAPAGAGSLSWAAAPRWVRASAAAALLAGVALGAGLGGTRGAAEERRASAGVPALTESYWALVDRPSETAAAPPELPSSPRGEARR